MNILQIKIDLKESKPNITRTVLVADNQTFLHLHRVIQAAMGWYDCHLHQFHIGEMYRGVMIGHKMEARDTGFGENGELDGAKIKLSKYLTEGTKIVYEYDFGDGWLHTLTVQKVLAPDPKQKYPVCTKGKNACPPEDCGGIYGYIELLETIADPKNEEYDAMREWLDLDEDETFDPTFFDLEEVNAELDGL